ncbi:MAG TPA: peptide chain release factor N(5)-glutamine methyltransferase [Verrucomicrobiota bacterium]|mgnify:CR=1 FL=1|nr:peptide chain release factor N(5)-glutamine methyltransferase [Verrucomicrobiota bacterium]
MTVLEAIQKSAEFLSKKGVESHRLQAELLLAHVLQLPRMKLYLNFERQLSATETDALRDFVKRRSLREPLQHIVGSTSFCGIEIAVNRHVLVPRPETELLAEMGWKFLNGGNEHSTFNIQHSTSNEGHAGSETGAPTALDFGTGSGCIAIAMAVKCPSARLTALDVSAGALDMARQNAERNQVSDRVEFMLGDGLSVLPVGRQFDLIVSNPPYIGAAEIESLQPEVKDFDPRGALDGGADGLDFYRMFAAKAAPFIKPGGKCMLEFGDGQSAGILKIFEEQNWIVEAVKDDYSRRPRFLIARPR